MQVAIHVYAAMPLSTVSQQDVWEMPVTKAPVSAQKAAGIGDSATIPETLPIVAIHAITLFNLLQ